jgi:type III secretory pathway component EscS
MSVSQVGGAGGEAGGRSYSRLIAAALVATLGSAYIVGVVSGVIATEHRLDLAHLGLIILLVIVVSILLRAEWLSRIKLFKFGDLQIELLEQVREAQIKNDRQLEDIRLVLPLLLPKSELVHLMNLQEGRTASYRGGNALRAELRRLRSIGLIQMRPNRTVGEMTSGTVFDLGECVELTSLGRRWAMRIREIEKTDAAAADERT